MMKMQVMKSFGVLLMNVLMFVALGLSRPVRADVFSNVPEASSYTLVYTLPIPTGADLNKNAIPYSVDNSAGTPATFDRVAYYLELQSGAGALQYVFVSFDKLAGMTASNQIGVPNVASGEFYQALLANMNVASNVAGLTTGTGIATGNIEFWPSNYSTPNDNSVPNADGSTYDFGDGGADTSAGYGSMQLHNYDVDGAGAGTVGQTLLAYNQWGSGGGELGIDNQSSGNPDWTFAGNVASYTVRNLQILVRLPDTAQTTPNFVVNNTADYDDGTCGVAHCTLREAINAANSNTDASLITFSSLFNSAQTVMVDNDLPAISAETTLTGPGATLLTVQENGAAQLLDIFTVSNRARATFSALTISGGYDGIFNRNGTLMLADCTFSDNRAALESRGTATATVTNCLFSDNIYGVANIGGTALTTDCTFSDNDLGTLVYGGTLTSTNCTFRRNSYGIATDIGGDATANGCTFRPNLYGVYNGDGTVQVTNSIFSGNFDGIHNEVGTATVTNSSFSANDVGIHNLDATPVTNCTFNNNSFGIYNEGGALTTTNCTLSGNNDKGIFVFGGTVNVQNSIVAGNTNFDIDGTFTNGGSNIIGGTALAAGLETDGTGKPLLRHNGGPTPSIAIVPGSPAHGNANPATTPVTDQRGFLRPLPGVGKPDIGAVELEVLVTSNPVVTETPGGTIASFIVDLGSPALRVITFDAVTSDYSALAGSDYIARALKSYSIGIGQSNKVITVPILDDNVDEIQETFLLLLSNSNKASIRANGGILGGRATIIDDDAVPTVSVADLPGVREGSSGTQNRSFTVKLSAPGTKTAVVDYAFNGTATYGTDYNAPAGNSGTLTFAPGETSKSVAVQIYGDTQPEDDESIRLQLTKVSGAVAGQVIGTLLILNDDTIVSVNNLPPLQEKSAGSQSRHFTVSLAFASSNTVSVAYGFATSNAATYGDDFTAPGGNAATLTFAPGETSKSVFVDVLGDTLPENDEPISIQLLNVVNGVFDGTARTGQLLIVNDDAAPSLSLNDVIQAEGSGGMTNFTFTVTLSKVSGQVVTVSYQTANGSAVKPGDYIGKAGTLTFAPGETTKTITVTVAGDAVHENDETFTVDLSNPVNATLLDGQGQGTILDDDASI